MSLRLRRVQGDDGATLVLALIVLMVFGLILGALFGNAGANSRSTPFVRAHLNNVYAADAGVDTGIERLRTDSSYCTDGSDPEVETVPDLANGHAVEISCAVLGSSRAGIGAAGYAVIVEGGSPTDPSLKTILGSKLKEITGPVFLSGATDLKQPLRVQAGNVDNLCGSAVQPAAADLQLDEGFRYSPCRTTRPQVPHVLPQEPCAGAGASTCLRGAVGFPLSVVGPPAVVAACQLFLPGTYRSAPQLVAGKINYFASGVYHFENIGAWTVANTAIVAGSQVTAPDNAAECTKAAPTAALAPTATEAGLAAVSGFGATFVFSGTSYMDMGANSEFTIHPRLAATGTPAWTERLSVVALKDAVGQPSGWSSFTSGRTDDVVKPQPGNTPVIVINGVYYTPRASLTVGATNTVRTEYLGGLVVDRLTIAESASAIRLTISIGFLPGDRIVRLTSRAVRLATEPTGAKPITSVAVATVSKSAGFPVTISSWRSSAPDF